MLVLSDRIKQTSITTGSGTITLADTYGGFESFANGIGEGNSTYYTIENGSNYEVGIGTYSSNTLSRDLVLDSSNNNNRISLQGVSVVFCTYPASHSFFLTPGGYASGQMPHYSGVAFPDGTIQTSAAQSLLNGSNNAIAYWSDNSTISYIDEVTWDSSISGLFVNGDLFVGDDVTISGNTTFYRDSAGCFFHGYVDNTYDKMIALYSDNATNPTWKLGVKPYSTDFTTPPTQGWIEGKNGTISINSDTSSSIKVDYTTGLTFTHKSNSLLTLSRDFGTVVNGINPATVPLTVKAAAAQSDNVQEWTDYSNSVVASVNASGQIDISSIRFPDNTIQSTAFRATALVYKTITSSTNLDPLDDVIFADCSSSSINITLPTASGVGGKKIIIKRKATGGSNSLTVSALGSEEIDGGSNFSMFYANEATTIISDNSNWYRI